MASPSTDRFLETRTAPTDSSWVNLLDSLKSGSQWQGSGQCAPTSLHSNTEKSRQSGDGPTVVERTVFERGGLTLAPRGARKNSSTARTLLKLQ
jgi:hypothetical protein